MTLPEAPPLSDAETVIAGQRAHWRKMTWAIIAWCTLILIWAVAGGASSANNCSHQNGNLYLSARSAQNACDAGTGIGVALILVVGFCGFVVLALIWIMSRPTQRTA